MTSTFSADRGDRIRRTGVPVGEVARSRDLEGAEHAEIEMAAADHAERVGVMEVGAAGEERHRLLAGVDQVFVLLARGRARADAEHAVLAVQDDLAALGQVVGDERRQPDAEVHVGALGNVARHARGDLLAVDFLHAAFRILAMRTTRCT